MLFIKKIFSIVLIFSFFTQSLSATPFFDRVKTHLGGDVLDIHEYPGTPVRISSPSNPKEVLYVSQARARRFLGISPHGTPISPSENIQVEEPLFVRGLPVLEGAEAPLMKVTYTSRLLSKLVCQEEMQCALVREFIRPFLTLHLEVEFLDVSGLIFCSPLVEDISSFEGNIFEPRWVESNYQYLRPNQHYRLRFSKFKPRSLLIDGESRRVEDVDYPHEERTSWLELFFPFPRNVREERARAFPRESVTALALLSVSLNPVLRLSPDFEGRRRGGGSYIFYDLQAEGYNGLSTKLDSRTVDLFLAQSPEYSILRLFESPLIFETKMRFSVLREAIESMRRAQRVLRELQSAGEAGHEEREESLRKPHSKVGSPLEKRPLRRRSSKEITVLRFLQAAEEMWDRESSGRVAERTSPWEDASLVYEALLQEFFDVSDEDSLPKAEIFLHHLRRYKDLLQEKGMPLEPKTTKAPQQMRFGSRMNNWLYALLRNSQISLSDVLPWALYFGFDIDYRPSLRHPSLVTHYTRVKNFEALDLLLRNKASLREKGKISSPVDEAVAQRYKEAFCLFLRRSSPPSRISLLFPDEALRWYHELEDRGELDHEYKMAFRTLSEQHPSFAWFRLLDQFLIRKGMVLESWRATERRKREIAGRKFESLLTEMRQVSEEERPKYFERYSFEYFFQMFSLREDANLEEAVRGEIKERFGTSRGGSSRELEAFQEARPGVTTVEEFLSVEMMRRFLEGRLLRSILLPNGQSLTHAQQELKRWAIVYLCSLDAGLREDRLDTLPVCQGYFGSYVLPPSFRQWLEDPTSIPPDGLTFKLLEGDPISIYPTSGWMTSKMAAHVFLSRLPGSRGKFECVRIGFGETGFRDISIFPDTENFGTSSLAERDGKLRVQTGTRAEYPVSFESLSHHLIHLLLLMPNTHLPEDTALSFENGVAHFSFGGRDQSFFQVSPFRSHAPVFTVEILKKIPVDPKARAFFQDLDPDQTIVDWLVELVRLQSLQVKDETEEYRLPFSHQEIGAFYLRLRFLRHILRESRAPLTHWDLLRYMNPWKTYKIKDTTRSADVSSENLVLPPLSSYARDVQEQVVSRVFKSWMQDDEMGAWFGDWAAFQDTATQVQRFQVMRASRIPPTYVIIPEAEDVEREDLDAVALQGVSFLVMENQGFGKKLGRPSGEVSASLKRFLSRVAESRTLLYLRTPRLGGIHLLQQNVAFRSESLTEMILDGTPFQILSVEAPFLRILSLRGCNFLMRLILKTPSLNNLDLTGASSFTDDSFHQVMKGFSELPTIKLEGTSVRFPDFRSLALDVEEQDFGLMTKRLIGTLDDFLNGRGQLKKDLLCGDAADQVRRVLQKTLAGPLRDVRTVGLWVQRTWRKWRSPIQDITEGETYGATDVLRAPIATPLAATASGVGYWGVPLVAAHPAFWAAAPVMWWVGGSVKSVRREIEEGKRRAEVLLGKILARAIQERGQKVANFQGIGLNCAGVISFFMEGGGDGLRRLNLRNNDLGEAGGEFLREMFAAGNHTSLVVELGGNGISPGLLGAIKRLTSSENEDERDHTSLEQLSEPHALLSSVAERTDPEAVEEREGGLQEALLLSPVTSHAERSPSSTLSSKEKRGSRVGGLEDIAEENEEAPPNEGEMRVVQEGAAPLVKEGEGEVMPVHLPSEPLSQGEDLLEARPEGVGLQEGGTSVAPQERPRSTSPFEVVQDSYQQNAGKTFFALHVNGALGPDIHEVLTVLEVMEEILQKPLGAFFHAIGGSHGGAVVSLISAIPPAVSSKVPFSTRVPPSISQFKGTFGEVAADLRPNYNLGDHDPLFLWNPLLSTFWADYFKDRSMPEARTSLVLAFEKDGDPVIVMDEEGEEKISPSSVATVLSHLPWPYHVGSSDSMIQTTSRMLVERVKIRFPGAQDGNIHVISLNWSINPQDLRNAERNGGRIISSDTSEERSLYSEFQFFFTGTSSWSNPRQFAEKREIREAVMRRAFGDWFRAEVMPLLPQEIL